MTTRRNGGKVLTILSGVFSFLLALYALAAVRGIDLRQNTLLSAAYCVLPMLSLPFFFLAFSARWLLLVQAILALAYIPVYAAMNWRTCAELAYCGSVSSVVLTTIATSKVMLFLSVALSSLAAFVLERRQEDRHTEKKRKC